MRERVSSCWFLVHGRKCRISPSFPPSHSSTVCINSLIFFLAPEKKLIKKNQKQEKGSSLWRACWFCFHQCLHAQAISIDEVIEFAAKMYLFTMHHRSSMKRGKEAQPLPASSQSYTPPHKKQFPNQRPEMSLGVAFSACTRAHDALPYSEYFPLSFPPVCAHTCVPPHTYHANVAHAPPLLHEERKGDASTSFLSFFHSYSACTHVSPSESTTGNVFGCGTRALTHARAHRCTAVPTRGGVPSFLFSFYFFLFCTKP